MTVDEGQPWDLRVSALGAPHRQLISVRDARAWADALRACGAHDVYHLAVYHELGAATDGGEPRLFWYCDGDGSAALPLLFRQIPTPGTDVTVPSVDATSVYGYPGPVASIAEDHPAASMFKSRFQRELHDALRELDTVSCFIRHHPLLDHSWLLEGCGRTRCLGPTIALDLRRPIETLGASKRYRQNLKQAQQSGATVHGDPALSRIGEFASLYRETMRRLRTDEYYCFSDEYFQQLASSLGKNALLFHALLDGRMIASVLVFRCGEILQYHLSASREEYARFAPTRLILDYIWRWGRDNGAKWFHLGGGVGSRRDSLFRFKAGFSEDEYEFKVTNIIFNQPAYASLCHRSGIPVVAGTDAVFFPEYRSPPIATG